MIPIYEQDHGNGIGHGLESFLRRFDEICLEHIKAGRAKAFAFIFYDFVDQEFRRVLKNQGVFAQLDRMAGNNLSIFYLHTGTEHAVQRFNSTFLEKLNLNGKAAPPCVVFFQLKKDRIENVAVAQLDNANLVHGFHELYNVIEQYIVGGNLSEGTGLRWLKWFKSGGTFFTVEAFRAVLRKAFELLF